MKIIKAVLLTILFAFALIQFIRPGKNRSVIDPSKDISAAIAVPPDVNALLRESCYDCHSDDTRYPWYAEIQPVGWWLADHIDHGRGHLNFSRFATIPLHRQYHKLEEITEQINLDEMPLPSYLIAHSDAGLSLEQKEIIHAWVDASRASMRERYPPDSLERR